MTSSKHRVRGDAGAKISIHITPPALLTSQSFHACYRGGKIEVSIPAVFASSPNPAPDTRQDNVTKKIGGYEKGVKSPLVMLRPNPA